MIITKLCVDGYKNLKDIDISLCDSLNVFAGENAQGKTNLIESIWLCSGVKSFRNTKEKDFIDINRNKADIKLYYKDKLRQQDISVTMLSENIKDKNILLNGIKQKYMSSLFGNLKCVVFTPEDLLLAKGSPQIRRNFIDLCISQIKPSYKDVITKYDTLIVQRNAMLKNIAFGKSHSKDLIIWDEQIARFGAYISVLRYSYTKKLNVYATKLCKSMSENKEKLNISYYSTVFSDLEKNTDFKGKMYEQYLNKLQSNIENDIKSGFTGVGIHRDDILTSINNLPTREFGSQGQQRSVALSFKLSQAYILKQETDESPVVLLDDVLSELDNKRQQFILSSIKDMQVIITCCNVDSIDLNINKGYIFTIKNGQIIKTDKGV